MLPQYKPNIIPIPLVILKESLLQRKINDVLDQTTKLSNLWHSRDTPKYIIPMTK